MVLPYIKMNLPQVYMCSPSWTLLPPPSPYQPSGSSQCTSSKHPVPCIELGLATCFIYDIVHVSMPFSKIIPPSPSPTKSKRLFYTLVSLLLSHLQGYRYHLSKFHIYALVSFIHVEDCPVPLPGSHWRVLLVLTVRAFVMQIWVTWVIIASQCCVGVCHTARWISHKHTYIPSLLGLPPTSPSHPSRSSQSTKLSSH